MIQNLSSYRILYPRTWLLVTGCTKMAIWMLILTTTFYAGVQHSRQQLRDLSEAMVAQPVNSFTRCLTEAWEASGELDTNWKGARKWQLK